jgi:hypothetical protein
VHYIQKEATLEVFCPPDYFMDLKPNSPDFISQSCGRHNLKPKFFANHIEYIALYPADPTSPVISSE